MYNYAKHKNEKKEQQAALFKDQKDEKELSECTFQPKLFTKDEDVDRLRDESFYDGVPKGFKVELFKWEFWLIF